MQIKIDNWYKRKQRAKTLVKTPEILTGIEITEDMSWLDVLFNKGITLVEATAEDIERAKVSAEKGAK